MESSRPLAGLGRSRAREIIKTVRKGEPAHRSEDAAAVIGYASVRIEFIDSSLRRPSSAGWLSLVLAAMALVLGVVALYRHEWNAIIYVAFGVGLAYVPWRRRRYAVERERAARAAVETERRYPS